MGYQPRQARVEPARCFVCDGACGDGWQWTTVDGVPVCESTLCLYALLEIAVEIEGREPELGHVDRRPRAGSSVVATRDLPRPDPQRPAPPGSILYVEPGVVWK